MKEDERGSQKKLLEKEKQKMDEDFGYLRDQLDEQKSVISNQRQLLNKLQVLNEVTQGCITQSAADLAGKKKEAQGLSIQITDKTRGEKKLEQRHDYLQNEIKNCIPTQVGPDGSIIAKYDPNEVMIVPGKQRRYNIANSQYELVN